MTPILSKVYENLVSHELFSFGGKSSFLPAVQFAYIWFAQFAFTISHHLQKTLDTGIESYNVQLYFSASFERVSHSGLLFKLILLGVGGSVLSICREFLFDRRQKVVVHDATSEWIPIVSDVPHGSVFGPLLLILYYWLYTTK